MKNQANTTAVKNANSMRIGFKITTLNYEERTCNVTVTCGYGEGDKQKKSYKDVRVSSLLLFRFQSNPMDYQLNKFYESDDKSSDWKENPFQLIRYRDEDDKIVDLLSCVDERKSYVVTDTDMFGNTIAERRYKSHKPSYYRRWRNRVRKLETTEGNS